MPRRRKGARVLGPYPNRKGFRLAEFAPDGSKTWSATFATEEEADEYKAFLEEAIATRQLTTDDAFDAYVEHMEEKGNNAKSIATTRAAVKRFFPEPLPLWGLCEKHCQERYASLIGDLSVATHRNYLAQVKTFLDWCVESRLLRANPATGVKGIGKRNKRKPQLRIAEARRWYRKAVDLAEGGDDGAIAALIALLMGLRASEITGLRIGDIDTAEEPADTIWIDKGKTDKAARTLEVPTILRPMLLEAIEHRDKTEYVFAAADGRAHWRSWPRAQVHRICADADVKPITAHSLRGMLASFSMRRGAVGELVADVLGHENQKTTRESYAEPGAGEEGDRRRGLTILDGGKRG